MLPIFLEKLDVGSIHVYSPRTSVFVCGGAQQEDEALPPKSIRDALLRAGHLPDITKSTLFVVEKVTGQFLQEQVYGDFYEFENDMAQVCDLVLLVSESPGSFTELGSFTRDEEVAKKLFTVIRNAHFGNGSYIDVGPIKYLENRQPGSVFVVSDEDYSVDESDYAKLDTQLLIDRLKEPVRNKMNDAAEHTHFSKDRNGHICKLIVGLAQEFGALDIEEVKEVLKFLEIPAEKTSAERVIFCGKIVDWLKTDRRGLRTFVLPKVQKRAAKFAFKDDEISRSTERRRFEIMEYWKEHDVERSTAILENSAAKEVVV